MRNRKFLYIFFLALLLLSCSNKNSTVGFYSTSASISDEIDTTVVDDSEITDATAYSNDYNESNIVAIPFNVKNGVKTVPVTINDVIGVDMIVDTGCSGALISVSEARYLAEKGALTIDDLLGAENIVIADGSIVENMVVHLKKLSIGGKLIATDVTATVSNNIQAPLLLGNEVLNRVKSIAIDNEKRQILFQLYWK